MSLFNFHHHATIATGDEHKQYPLLAGRSGGQKLIGGIEASDEVRLQGIVSDNDYTAIEPDGTVRFAGAAVVWDDLRVPVTSTKKGGSKDPDFTVAYDDSGGTSQGVFTYFFDKTAEQELYFSAQLPHGYKEGTDIIAHVHWFPVANGASGATVSWGFEYLWTNIGGTSGNTVIIYANDTIQEDAVLAANKHYQTNFAALSGTGKTISSMLMCRIFRDAGGTGLTDDYDNDAGLLEIDFHYEKDTAGSRTVLTK